MHISKLIARASLVGLAFGLIQGCTAVPHRATADDSFADTVTESLYKKRVYITGSRIPKVIDVRESIEMQSVQPVRIVEMQ